MPGTGNQTAPLRIDPRKVMNRRRRLKFAAMDDILAEGSRLMALVKGQNSEREDLAGPEARVVHLANMPLGQALGHLGLTLDGAVSGMDFSFPLPMRLMARVFKAKILNGDFSAPFQQPPALNLIITPPFEMNSAAGMEILRKSISAFESADSLRPNAMFGVLSREEWIELTCRHAEWHLSFMLER